MMEQHPLADALAKIGSGCTASPDDIENETVLWMQGIARDALAQYEKADTDRDQLREALDCARRNFYQMQCGAGSMAKTLRKIADSEDCPEPIKHMALATLNSRTDHAAALASKTAQPDRDQLREALTAEEQRAVSEELETLAKRWECSGRYSSTRVSAFYRAALASKTAIDPVTVERDKGLVEDESAWLIEYGPSEPCAPLYWGGVKGWTEYHDQAVRFAREVDAQSQAEAMDDGFMGNYRIAEHAWMGSRS